jgi:hypothetical protein
LKSSRWDKITYKYELQFSNNTYIHFLYFSSQQTNQAPKRKMSIASQDNSSHSDESQDHSNHSDESISSEKLEKMMWEEIKDTIEAQLQAHLEGQLEAIAGKTSWYL